MFGSKSSRILPFVFSLIVVALSTVGVSAFASTWVNNQNAASVLGQPSFGSSTAAAGATGLYQPSAVRFDETSGKVFVTDCANNRVLRFANAQAFTSGGPAEAAFGQSDLNVTVGGSSQSKIRCAGEIAVDSGGHLWLADTTNSRVLRWDNAATAASGTAAAAVLGQPDFTSNTSATTASKMAYPEGIYIDPNGRLWVADSGNNRVLRFDQPLNKANGAAADAVLGTSDFVTNAASMSQTGMASPNSITGNISGAIWVSDSGNNRVLRFDSAASKFNGGAADYVLGSSAFDSIPADRTTSATLDSPGGLAFDAQNRLYVADTANARVLIFGNASGLGSGAPATNVLGQPNFTTAVATLSQSGFDMPYSPSIDPTTQSLFVADVANNRVMRFVPQTATSGNVAISGRVTDRAGAGIRNARVIFTDQLGASRQVITNSYGYFTFADIPTGTSLTANVTAKGFTFQPRMIQVMDNLTDINFVAQ